MMGNVTVCSAERTIRVLWRSVARHGWLGTLKIGIRASVFNTEPEWAKRVELRRNYTKYLFRTVQISSCRASIVNFGNNDVELGKTPIPIAKFVRKWRNPSMR
jgi:hypothetical protein